jgi:5-methylcytosine-specific restriction endonuclease McrA
MKIKKHVNDVKVALKSFYKRNRLQNRCRIYTFKTKKTYDKKRREDKKQKGKKQIMQSIPYTGKPSNSARNAKKRAKKLGRLSENADYTIISSVYMECRQLNRQFGYHVFDVDHIIPLAFGGLHHEDNLQILPVLAHRVKTDKDKEKYGT